MKHHVVTSLARFENIRKLIEMLEPQKIHWHVIIDHDTPFHLWFSQPWITCYRFDNKYGPFWERCHGALNWWLEIQNINWNDKYCFLNDDDAYEPDFFKKVAEHKGDLIITSMERGHNTPPGVAPERAHGTNKLEARPDLMVPGNVGLEQMIVSGSILANERVPMTIAGDGEMISAIVRRFTAEYAPEASVWFNYFEPGRWNK